jgi:hypothetical protein
MSWRDKYKVHPAADVFPMMSDEELAALGEDIKKNGLREPITLEHTGLLCDGRNRLEAMERIGLDLDNVRNQNGAKLFGGPVGHVNHLAKTTDPVAFIISKNIHRRHLTKQQQADLIVAAVKAGKASRQLDEVPKRHVQGKAGSERDAVKEAAVKAGAEHGIGKRTVERSFAKSPEAARRMVKRIERGRRKEEQQENDNARKAEDADAIAELRSILVRHLPPAALKRVRKLLRTPGVALGLFTAL